jgi:hypothetical protein
VGFHEEWQVHAVTRKEKVAYRDEKTPVELHAACACLVDSTENTSLTDKLICNK